MRKVMRFGMIAVLAIGAVATSAFAGTVTVGRFYTQIAQAKQLGSVDAVSAEANLRNAGFNLPKLALDKSLSEGDMTSISAALGIAVSTERPAAPVNEAQLNTFMASFGSQIGLQKAPLANPVQTYDLPPQSGNGKGKKKGHHKSTSEPI